MLVTAAFIGPGTVTACTSAGIGFGTALLWALAFATVATILLQVMSAKVAIITGMGLGEAILSAAPNPLVRVAIGLLIFAALALGNAAYQSGNIAGTALGLKLLGLDLAGTPDWALPLGIGSAATLLIVVGKPRWLETLLIALVLAMSAAFLVAVLVIDTDWSAVASGFVPNLPAGSIFTTVALIGTTIVPYNLFLHAASVRNRFDKTQQGLTLSRNDTVFAVLIGGLLSMLIVIIGSAAATGPGDLSNGANALDQTATSLETLFGAPARIVFALGLIGAGFSSALTAPIATGYVVQELFGKTDGMSGQILFKAAAALTILIGTGLACLAINPVQLILIAQSANGVLLPVSAGFLIWVAGRRATMGAFVNRWPEKLAGAIVFLVCSTLGLRLILRTLGYWP